MGERIQAAINFCGRCKDKFIEFLSEENGKLSNTRIVIFLLVISYIGWNTYLIIGEKEVLTIPDIPTNVVWLISALYGFNKTNINLGQSK